MKRLLCFQNTASLLPEVNYPPPPSLEAELTKLLEDEAPIQPIKPKRTRKPKEAGR